MTSCKGLLVSYSMVLAALPILARPYFGGCTCNRSFSKNPSNGVNNPASPLTPQHQALQSSESKSPGTHRGRSTEPCSRVRFSQWPCCDKDKGNLMMSIATTGAPLSMSTWDSDVITESANLVILSPETRLARDGLQSLIKGGYRRADVQLLGCGSSSLAGQHATGDDPLATVKQTLHPKYIRPAPLRP